MEIRVGNGYDVHRFADTPEDGACVVLAGLKIPHSHRLLAHSDGDVLAHALCDALLGSIALGDIGRHFPDTDPQYQGADSMLLLGHVQQLLRNQGWQLSNADLTVVAQAPRLAPHVDAMRANLAATLHVPVDRISIKATTTEGLGFTGRREGIAVIASVLVTRGT